MESIPPRLDRRISDPLEGEDAQRFADYIHNPQPPEGHAAFLEECDAAFNEIYSPKPANEAFEENKASDASGSGASAS